MFFLNIFLVLCIDWFLFAFGDFVFVFGCLFALGGGGSRIEMAFCVLNS